MFIAEDVNTSARKKGDSENEKDFISMLSADCLCGNYDSM